MRIGRPEHCTVRNIEGATNSTCIGADRLKSQMTRAVEDLLMGWGINSGNLILAFAAISVEWQRLCC